MKIFNFFFNRSKRYGLEVSKNLLEINEILYKQGFSHKDREIILNLNKEIKNKHVNRKQYRNIIVLIKDFKKEEYITNYDITRFSERISDTMFFKRKQKEDIETMDNQVKRIINEYETRSIKLAQAIKVLERKKDNAAFENNRNEFDSLNHQVIKFSREKNIIDKDITRLRGFEIELLTKELTSTSLESIKLMDENSIDINLIEDVINEGYNLDLEQEERKNVMAKLDQNENYSSDFDKRREKVVIERSLEKTLEEDLLKEDEKL